MMADKLMQIDGTTRLMGVIGDPIAQIKTPQAINPIFAARGANIVCVPLHIEAAGLEAAWPGLKAMRNLVGFGVTLPHKMAVVDLCDSVDGVAREVGAVNVVRREADGAFKGYQFDGPGFVRGLVKQGHTLEGRNCLLIGAGGAAMAIAYSLLEAGIAHITIANRTTGKAEEMARRLNDRFGAGHAEAGEATPKPGALIVQATSIGMKPDDALPMDVALVDSTMLVAEVIAKPEMTRLLEEAAARGAQTHSGMHMIHNQVDLLAEHFMQVGR